MNNLMRRSGIIAVLCMLLCLCLLVCSCGNKGGDDETTPAGNDNVTTADPGDVTTADPGDDVTTADPDDDATTAPTPDVETVTYTVTVKNEAGVGIAGVGVQLCAEQCHPAVTNASGVATFTLPEAVYQAGITGAVSGYVVDTSAKYDFAVGATSLEIVLKAAAPAPTEGAIDLKNDENVITDNYPVLGEMVYLHGYIVGNLEAEEVEDALVDVQAGDSVVYTYEATADGEIALQVIQALGTKVSVKNITTGVTYEPLSGIGLMQLPITAGNTYEITVNYTLTEKVLYVVAAGAYPDGSKDAPYYLGEGTVATDVVIPEGETVWFYLEDYYFLIENPSVKVNVNGILYSPNADGIIDMSVLDYPYGLIGISSSIADAKVEIKLSGSCEDAPLTIYYPEDLADLDIAGKTVYCQFINESGKDIFTITTNGGKVEALGLAGRNGSAEAVDTNEAENILTVDAAGYNVLYVVIEGATGAYATVEVPSVPGSERDPFELTFTEGAATLTITKEMVDEIGPQGFMGYAVWYTYTATADCSITLTVPQIEGAGMWDLNAVDCPYGIETESELSDYYPTETGMVIDLVEGDSVRIAVIFGSAQYEAGTDLVVTVTLA
ncbi:MAG: hypothetical protein IKC26_09905 [Clostridia bacterium]|nr:hypothetical protein [Clostridia bacterium]MBR2908335.1 hypothetical protein [Clostridia bacterium]